MIHRLWVPGTPQPKGSMKCIGGRGKTRHQLIEDDKTGRRRVWRRQQTETRRESGMKPYYEDDSVTLYHGDCLELADLWTVADVLVTDPPYGIAYTPNHRTASMKLCPVAGDTSIDARDHAVRLWGDARPALLFGRWDMPRPRGTRDRLVWDKQLIGTGRIGSPWGPSDEEIYVLGDWPPIIPGGRAREGGTPARHSSVVRVQALAPGATARPDHPTPKPIPLMEALIAKCPPGVIADPFAGSGSTLVAAKALGRKAIGVELEERYCEIAARRLSQDVLDFGGGEERRHAR